MDQGLAAVLGASVGVAGTLGAACFAYIAARRQARDQGQVDHDRQLRAERRAAYLDFLRAVESIDHNLRRLGYGQGAANHLPLNPRSRRRLGIEVVDDLGAAVSQIHLLTVQIDLVGPEEVTGPAREIRYVARDMQECVICLLSTGRQPDTGPDIFQLMGDLDARRNEFARVIRRVMEMSP